MADLIWVVTGIILLGAMVAGGISLFVKRRKNAASISSGDVWTKDLDKKDDADSEFRP